MRLGKPGYRWGNFSGDSSFLPDTESQAVEIMMVNFGTGRAYRKASEGREAEDPFKGIEGWAGSFPSTSPAAFTPTPTLCRRGCTPRSNSSIRIIRILMSLAVESSNNHFTDWARIASCDPRTVDWESEIYSGSLTPFGMTSRL